MREFDEKKMDRLERILLSKRKSSCPENSIDPSSFALSASISSKAKLFKQKTALPVSNTTTSSSSPYAVISGMPSVGPSVNSSLTSLLYGNGGPSKGSSNGVAGQGPSLEYYRDRGRQPNKF
jgi:hypothetical protein